MSGLQALFDEALGTIPVIPFLFGMVQDRAVIELTGYNVSEC